MAGDAGVRFRLRHRRLPGAGARRQVAGARLAAARPPVHRTRMDRHERPAPRLRAVRDRLRGDGRARRPAADRTAGRDLGNALDGLGTRRCRQPVVDAAQLHVARAASGRPEPRIRPDFQPDCLHRRPVRPARTARRRACRHPGLCRRRPRGGVRRRLDHAVRLLGTDGGGVAVRGVVRRHGAVAGGRVPLSAGAHFRRLAAVLRDFAPPAARRRDHLGGPDAKRHAGRRLLAHSAGRGDQRRGAAAARLADGRLPGSLGHRQRVSERLHHQDGGVRAHTPVSRCRGAAVGRGGHDPVRRRLRPSWRTTSAGCWPTTSSARSATWWPRWAWARRWP